MRRYNIDYEKMYSEYIYQYSKTKKYAQSRGGRIRDLKPSSYKDFKTDFRSILEDNPGKGPKQLAQQMAKDELYETSSAQARKLAQVHEEVFGEKFSIKTIAQYRLGLDQQLWDAIKQRRAQIKEENPELSTYKINIIIGQEFFGS